MTPCPVTGCPNPGRSTGALCDSHRKRLARTGTVMADKPVKRWGIDPPGYASAHMRLRRILGPASAHMCECGCGQQARYWAYDHSDPCPLRSPEGYPYSLDPERYWPLAGSCHALWDRSRAS